MSRSTNEYEAPAVGNDDLALVLTDDEGEAIPLRGRRVTIGRAHANDLVLDDSFVSSQHCMVEERHGVYRVQDLGSRNGTKLNGVRVERGLIRAGDRLRVGRAMLLCVRRSPFKRGWRGPGGLVGRSLPMRRVLVDLARFAARTAPVLIEGETGTGKELAAQAVHRLSRCQGGPFVAVNCGALTPELAMSELFGHERGAFTGAALRHRGAFEQAEGGTLFLDEVGELDARVQAALLRVLESSRIRRVGSEQDRSVNVRIVAATNRELMTEIRLGGFRLDLYHRLAVFRVLMPPLRQRSGDLSDLAQVLLEGMGSMATISPEALELLSAHDWPGNVREFRNVLERALALAESDRIEARDLRFDVAQGHSTDGGLASLQNCIREHGSIAAAARGLGVPRTTLRDRLYKLQAEQEPS